MTKLYSDTKKNILELSNRQVDILRAMLGYMAMNFGDLNDSYWNSEEDLLKLYRKGNIIYMPELNEVEIENLRKLIDSLPG